MSRALQIATKWFILNTIIKSKTIISEKDVDRVTGLVMVSDTEMIATLSAQELRKLRVT